MQISMDPTAPNGLLITDEDGASGVVTMLIGSDGEVVRSLASALTAVVYWGHNRTMPWRTIDVSRYLDQPLG